MRTVYHAMIIVLIRLSSVGSEDGVRIVLTQMPEEAEENHSVVLSCNSTFDPIDGFMIWRLNGHTYVVNMKDNPCRASGYPLNRTDRYILNCSDIHNISLTIRNVDRLQHGDAWLCEVGFATSNTVTIDVRVPVATLNLTFTDTGFIAENKTSMFHCKSSFSRPKPEIYWFLSYGTPVFEDDERLTSNINELLVNKTVGNRPDNILTSTESKLALKVQRTMNNQKIYCLTNGTSGRVLRSTMTTLNISYPPSDIVITIRIQSTAVSVSKVVNMLENNSYILTCSARGKPEPKYSWTGPVNASSDVLNFTSINRVIAGYYTCLAKNTMNESTGSIYNGNESKTIYLNIQYSSETKDPVYTNLKL